MKRVKDHVRQGSEPQIRGNLADISTQLARCAAKLPIEPIDDYIGLVSTRLLRTISRDLRLAAPQFKKDIFAFAWRTRNIFESVLLLAYTYSNAEFAAQFAAQKLGDERTILDGFTSLADPSMPEVQLLRDRSEKASRVLAKHGFDRASPWRMDQVAASVGMKDEYAGFYKMYSKYVHPSAWGVLSEPDEYEPEPYWNVFLIQAQLHSLHAVSIGKDLIALRTSKKEA